MVVGIPNILRYYCTFYQESLLYIQIAIQNLEFLGMSEISSQFTFEQLGTSKLMGNVEDKTDPPVRRWPQGTANHIVVDWRGGASELVPMQCNHSEKLLL
jgi:hypothetical protein